MSNAEVPPERPTLKTIAHMAGLGVSTVSQALKDGPEISEETRARVKLIARQIGYRPNRAGVRLRTGKTNVISVVLNAQEEGSGLVSNMVYGISNALINTPYHLVVTPYQLDDPMAPVRYIVETGSADGVIISRTQPSDPRVRYLTDHGVPFAAHGRTEMGIVHPSYDYDNEAFAVEALKLLKAQGRQRAVLLGPPPGLTFYKHTHLGFERGLQIHGMSGSAIGGHDIDSDLKEIRILGAELARRHHRPDGIVCSSATASIALAIGLADEGLTIGRDYDIVTKHSTELLALTWPNIIFMREDFREAGFELARMVMARIAGADSSNLQKLVAPAAI
jgi:LacI family transcriptional regulator